MNENTAKFQWVQLLALTGLHFFLDVFAGLLPAILPRILVRFSLTLTLGIMVLSSLNIACNAVQVLTGHLRHDKKRPLFLQIGLILATATCLMALLPASPSSFWLLIILTIISGCGIAVGHVEGLRAIHALEKIQPSMSTAVFLAGGFIGFACGGWISSMLVTAFDLQGLYTLFLVVPLGILMVIFLKIRLAVEDESVNSNTDIIATRQLSFWPIMSMVVPIATASAIIFAILPTLLEELNFEMTFGGFSLLVFGMGSMLGSLFWAWLAHKKDNLRFAIVLLLLGLPFFIAYFIFINNRAAVWILFVASFCSTSAYPLMVTMARNAKGLKLGQRMGIVVGGAWGIASLILMAIGPVADRFGTFVVLKYTPLGYLIAAIIGFYIMANKKNE